MEGLPVDSVVPSDPLPPEHPKNVKGTNKSRVTMDARIFSLHKPYQKFTGLTDPL